LAGWARQRGGAPAQEAVECLLGLLAGIHARGGLLRPVDALELVIDRCEYVSWLGHATGVAATSSTSRCFAACWRPPRLLTWEPGWRTCTWKTRKAQSWTSAPFRCWLRQPSRYRRALPGHLLLPVEWRREGRSW